jgi:hypothetical protein
MQEATDPPRRVPLCDPRGKLSEGDFVIVMIEVQKCYVIERQQMHNALIHEEYDFSPN